MRKFIVALTIVMLISCLASAQTDKLKEAVKTAKGTVESLYDLVTFEKGKVPDWNNVKFLFHKDAVITLRTSMADMTTMDVQGFVDLFIHDIEKMKLDTTGFVEEIKSIKVRQYGRQAHAFVIYSPSIPGSKRPPMLGLDSFTLIQEKNRWFITAIANDLIHPAKPVPEEFLK